MRQKEIAWVEMRDMGRRGGKRVEGLKVEGPKRLESCLWWRGRVARSLFDFETIRLTQ
jgi:hypothetical protein